MSTSSPTPASSSSPPIPAMVPCTPAKDISMIEPAASEGRRTRSACDGGNRLDRCSCVVAPYPTARATFSRRAAGPRAPGSQSKIW
jgi:hypothetical protein